MQTSTKLAHWLLTAFVMVAITSTATAQRTVTLQLNMATAPDTVDGLDEIQIRGQLGSGTALPDGGVIDWGDNTTLRANHLSGDYWETSFQIPDDDALQFKFYSPLLESDGLDGWENGDNHQVAAGTGDVTLPLHFFRKGSGAPYDWRPYEQKQDSIAVWFRVYANTEAGVTAGYSNDESDALVVAGDPLSGASMMNWGGDSGVVLTRESTDRAAPGYHLFSGAAYYPVSAAGTTQPYKFFVQPSGWEDGIPDRTFVVPDQDTTLAWVYFANSQPVNISPVQDDIIFSIDVTPLEEIGVFRRGRGDSLQVRGAFNGWGCADKSRCELQRVPGTNIFESVIGLNLLPEAVLEYKFRIDFNTPSVQDEWAIDVIPSGWEEPYSTSGGNRSTIYLPAPGDEIIEQRFNDIFPGNVMQAGERTDLVFNVDMTPALMAAEPFVPGQDTVMLAFRDPIWMMTQGIPLTPRDDDPNEGDQVDLAAFADRMVLEDPDGDMVYSGTFRMIGPTYAAFQYFIAYGSPSANTFTEEPGGGFSAQGTRRQRFIPRNPDGSFPAEFTIVNNREAGDMGPEVYTPEGALPFDPNPATATSIEQIGDELPQKITLSENFPNPFNPSTSFEYSLTQTAEVKVQVFDVLGRVVTTLVDAVQQPATYRLSFDASDLASGTYVYRLQTPTRTLTRTMVLLK